MISQQVTRSISITEAKAKLSELVSWSEEKNEIIILERYGKPASLIAPLEYMKKIQEENDREKRKEAFEKLKKLAARVRAKNPNITQSTADRVADEITRDAIKSIMKKRNIRYKN